MSLRDWLIQRPRLRGMLRLGLIAVATWWVLTEGRVPGVEVAFVAAACILVGMYYAPDYVYTWRPWRLLVFFAYFLRGSLLGGVDVARRVFRRRMPIEPGFVQYRARVPQGQPRTLLVSAISLMPGTLTAEVEGDDLVVHVLASGMEREVAALERLIGRLFVRRDAINPEGAGE